MSSRDAVLNRIRTALGPNPVALGIPREYRSHGEQPAGAPALLELLADRLIDYGAAVRRVGADEIPAAVNAALAEHDAYSVAVPAGLPRHYAPDAVVDDGLLTAAMLDRIDAVVTGCRVAIAETGTIVLDGGDGQGRRILTLVPDLHVCIVAADQVVGLVPEALPRLTPTAPLTFISGPSATSDIELSRVQGVHGPRKLSVIVVG